MTPPVQRPPGGNLQRPTRGDDPSDSSPAIVVLERHGRWAVALRRLLGINAACLREVRSLADLRDLLEQAPASIALLEVTRSRAETLLLELARLERRFPQARFFVLAERGLEPVLWASLEAGAAAVVTSPRRLAAVAARIQARLAQFGGNWPPITVG